MTKKKTAKSVPQSSRRQKMVSISPELLGKLDEHPDTNWSAVACQAFEIKLGELAAQKEQKTMTDVLARLKASKMKANAQEYNEGFELGKAWASDYAEFEELQRIAINKSKSHGTSYWEDSFTETENESYTVAERFYAVVAGEDRPHCRDVHEFYENNGVTDEQKSIGKFIHGFAEGALEVYEEVKDKI